MEKTIDKFLRGGAFLQLLDQQGLEIRKKYGLKRADLKILYYLAKNTEHNTAKDIQAYFNMNKGHISQTVDQLQKRGFITALPDARDRRLVHYKVTEKVAEVVEKTEQRWECINKKIFAGITEEELAVFRRVAGKIEINIRNMLN